MAKAHVQETIDIIEKLSESAQLTVHRFVKFIDNEEAQKNQRAKSKSRN